MDYLSKQEIHDYLDKSLTGYWKLEMVNGVAVRMYVDKNMQELIGAPDNLTPEECCAFFIEHIHPEDQLLMVPYGEEMMRGNAEVVYRYNHPKAGEIAVRCGGRRVKTEGDIATIIGYHKELADTIHIEGGKQREELLQRRSRDLQVQESQEYFWHLMDKISCGVIVYTIADHRILFMNSEALRIYGAKNIAEIQEHVADTIFTRTDAYTTSQLRRLRNEEFALDYECDIYGLDGKVTNALAHSEVTISLNGERCAYSTILDISENKTLRNEKGILNALCSDFVFVYLCDLKNNAAVQLKLNGRSYADCKDDGEQVNRQMDDDASDYAKRIKAYYDAFVDETQSADYLEKLDADFLMDYLPKHNGQMTYRYHLKPHPSGIEYMEIRVSQLESSDGFQVVMSFRVVDDIIREEKKRKNEVVRRLDQIKGLASQFVVLYFVNLDTLETENYYLDNELTPDGAKQIDKESVNFFEAFKGCMVAYAHPDFQEELMRYASVDYMREVLKDKRRHEYRFLCMDSNGGYKWTDMVVMKFTENENDVPVNIAVGYYNTDDEMRERLENARRTARDLEAIKGLANEYDTLYFVDLDEDAYSLYYLMENSPEAAKNSINEKEPFSSHHAKTMDMFCHPDYRDELLKFADMDYIRSVVSDQSKFVRRFLCDSDHGYRWCEFVVIRLDHEDSPKRVAVGYIDVDASVKKEMEQQKQLTEALVRAEDANNAKTTFLFNMSHDIRTPMNAIMGFRNLLEKHQEEPEKRADYLKKIDDASTVLLSIINNVLEMARIEKGALDIDETAWSAEQFNDTLYSIFEDMMCQKGIKFTRRIEVEHHYVYCDPIKLREIFTNILSNAYKYTNAGGHVHMHLKEIPSDREGYALYQTTITDTGIGMSKDFLPHLFEEFSREHNTTDSKVEGTGLGMPIMKRLVELMDGTVEVTSEQGVGTTFVVTIPHKVAERSNLVEHEGIVIDPKMFKDKRILLAEDNDLNAEIATEILSEAGFIVERAVDGAMCVDMLEKAPAKYYDLILMDIQMPNMNGYEATRTIRAMQDHEKSIIKILAMTANAFEEDKREALKSGMNGHLAKPIDVHLLMKVLASVLG